MDLPPQITLRLLRWERNELVEKDEEGRFVHDAAGAPVVLDTWVTLHLLSPTGRTLTVEIETEEFERDILPRYLSPLINFWATIEEGDKDFPNRNAVLMDLLQQKQNKDKLSLV
jgi:hypothetical protein